ncbi:MAG: hypothetical protein ACPG7W_10490 [Paracoccaceae bacterium]
MSRTLKALVAIGFVATVAACTQPTEETVVINPISPVAAEPVYTGKL